MLGRISKLFKKSPRVVRAREIDPDEILLDAANLPAFDSHQLEGRLLPPVGRRTIILAGVVFGCIALLFAARVWWLQVAEGERYQARSSSNTLRHTPVFATRGNIFDRHGELLAWNEPREDGDVVSRRYSTRSGLGHTLGYVKYPSRDAQGFFYTEDYRGVEGIERAYQEALAGVNGAKILEIDVAGAVVSESTFAPPRSGEDLTLSIDARITESLHRFISDRAETAPFLGGAGMLMDVRSGEVIALTSFPEYQSEVLTEGDDARKIARIVADEREPFLNRATEGLYTPGSTVKPFLALAALREGIVTPTTTVVSTGSISIPNPFDPKKKSVFMDWKAHGPVDLARAIAVSSNVYFYEIGGGFGTQQGLGIEKIGEYMRMFGFGEAPPDPYFARSVGTIPSPAWKEVNFPGDPWRIGDTYNTSIGQYGFQVTLLEELRAVAAIANGGVLVEPAIILHDAPQPVRRLPFTSDHIAAVSAGMRQAVTEGTAEGLNLPFVSVAAKTGTAEVGISKKRVNSWVIGFFPYERPRYAFGVIMERGPRENTVGALYVFRQFLEWLSENAPEYLDM